MKKDNSWASLLVAIWLSLVIWLYAISILEYIVPYWRNVKGIEFSADSFYRWASAVEDALWFISQNDLGSESSTIMPWWSTWYNYNITASWFILPPSSLWDSWYDKDFNTIFSWKPIQLEVWNNKLEHWSNNNYIDLYFKVPDLDMNTSTPETLSWWVNDKFILWQLNSKTDTLNASWSHLITIWDICSSNQDINTCRVRLNNNIWVKIDWTEQSFTNFYNSGNCDLWNNCTLRLSIIWKLELNSNNTSIPYLEWQAKNPALAIPLQNVIINSAWKSFGFQKYFWVSIPTESTIDAFDFTVFQ